MNRQGRHTKYDIQYHIVWTTKYRYKVLTGKMAEKLRELIRQGCEAKDITIIQGAIGKEHVHILISCGPNLSPAEIVQYLKRKSSRIMQEEYRELKSRYWGQNMWEPGYFCITEEMIKEYIKNQKDESEDTFRIIQ